jgi:hypothetical protein
MGADLMLVEQRLHQVVEHQRRSKGHHRIRSRQKVSGSLFQTWSGMKRRSHAAQHAKNVSKNGNFN